VGRPQEWSQTVTIEGGVGYLRLSHPDGRSAEHWFSPCHFELIASRHWSGKGRYAVTHITGRGMISLQNLILGIPIGSGGALTGDHIRTRDKHDSRDENIRITDKRGQAHNRHDQSAYGAGIIYQLRLNNYIVQVCFGSAHQYVFRPAITEVEIAKQVRDAFMEIARRYDAGLRELPTREELKSVSDGIRKENGKPSRNDRLRLR
jgi:hypothetical protein